MNKKNVTASLMATIPILLLVILIIQYLFHDIMVSFLVGLCFVIVFSPFIYLICDRICNRHLSLKSFEAFATPWIAFWGVIGLFLGAMQVYTQLQEQREQFKKQQCDTRFSSGVELLGNEKESARIGGAYNLYFLAKDNKEYLNPVCEIICAHVRTITSDTIYQKDYKNKPSNEIQTIIDLLLKKNKNNKSIFNDCIKDLEGTFLCGVNFFMDTLNNIDFDYAILNNVYFNAITLSNVFFQHATLSNIQFKNMYSITNNGNVHFCSTLNNVIFNYATLREVDFIGTTLDNVNFHDATLHNIQFQDAYSAKVKFGTLSCSTLNNVEFGYAILNGVDFSCSSLNNVNFLFSTLSNVKFRETESVVHNKVALFGTTLNNVNFGYAKLNGVDFSNAKLEGEIILMKTVLENYSYEEITSEGRSLELTGIEENIEEND